MDYTFSYLVANSALIFVCALLYLWRTDVRKEMLAMSLIFGVAGIFVEPIYVQDWWRPLTLLGTSVGIEDFLFGASIGGIAAVAYEVIFKKRMRPRVYSRERSYHESYLLLGSLALCAALFYGSFLAGFSSFESSVVSLSISTLLIWWHRKDLIVDSLVSGLLLDFFGLWWFWIAEFFTPGWVEKYWLHENLVGIVILKAPLEDLIWGFLAGAFIGPLYEFWKEQRLSAYGRKKRW